MTFDEAHTRVLAKTALSRERLEGLYRAVQTATAEGVPGDLVECGCFRGGSAAMLGLADESERHLWLFDTFEGMPEPGPEDPPAASRQVGQYRGSVEDVLGFLSACGLATRSTLVKGDMRDTLPCPGLSQIAVLHLDCDWYESVKQGLACLYDLVVPGGFVQVDDYGHWAGARKATDEFFAAREIDPALEVLDYTGRQHRKARAC